MAVFILAFILLLFAIFAIRKDGARTKGAKCYTNKGQARLDAALARFPLLKWVSNDIAGGASFALAPTDVKILGQRRALATDAVARAAVLLCGTRQTGVGTNGG